MTTRYTAVCRLSGGWWAISVPGLKGVHTQVRRLSDAEAMARDAIALFLDVDPGSFGVLLQPEVPDAGDVVSAALTARKVAQEADREAATATAVALRRLADLGITGRDAARLLNISPQRVSQLKKSGSDTPARTRKSGRRGSRRSAEV
ncbi:type II toxin-antitoxin system HicB family antitoxin [Dactylosporangium sp. AC04546]|uniref:type II toxin-antitoxin system HicB family antitoxin n=1 Tax=Dactylosporangium sp. AC04546 TaxID=2862460 RepID=UPI001EE06CA8|nr:type II toxin-antitoxin system HicB family antitoxin [Dactylosporangium sp. AC04546]WVK84162.1 type II toxin-antitoxin system HicB family antitoxin [Dactylosporangium sp. AC04546]